MTKVDKITTGLDKGDRERLFSLSPNTGLRGHSTSLGGKFKTGEILFHTMHP